MLLCLENVRIYFLKDILIKIFFEDLSKKEEDIL